MKTVNLKNSLIVVVAIVLVIVSCGGGNKNKERNAEGNEQTVSEKVSIGEDYVAPKSEFSQDVKEMRPTFRRMLDFNEKNAAEFQKIMDALKTVEWDFEKLTEKQKEYIEKHNISEVTESYWETVGGGCSWYCGGGPDSISASSYLKSNNANVNYLPENIHDFSFETAWVEGVKGYGIGEYITYHFRQTAPRITKIIIANGYVKSEKAFRENSRVKKLKMYIDDKPVAILNLEDIRSEQIFEFEPIGKERPSKNANWEELEKLPKWTLKFEILEVYQGDKYDDVAISEIYFDGIDVHCFAAGTKILMTDNSLKNIELIQAGDVIKSYDFENKKLIDSKVTRLISAIHLNLLKLKLTDNEIITTADHPFWIDRNVWAAVNAEEANRDYFQSTEVENLNVGDRVFIPEKNIFLEIIEIEKINERQITYTIELSKSDNFIANGMLVKTENAK